MDTRLWLKNYPTRSTLDYPKISLYHYLKKVADQYPNRTALIFIADRGHLPGDDGKYRPDGGRLYRDGVAKR